MAPPMKTEPFRLRTKRVSADGLDYYLEVEGATAAEAISRMMALVAAWNAVPNWGGGGPG